MKLLLAAIGLSTVCFLFSDCGDTTENPQSSCKSVGENSLILGGKWKLSFAEQPREAARTPSDFAKLKGIRTINAQVPGVAQLDLQNAGIEPDAMKGDNVYKYRKYEAYQWMYSRKFTAPKIANGQRAFLNLQVSIRLLTSS